MARIGSLAERALFDAVSRIGSLPAVRIRRWYRRMLSFCLYTTMDGVALEVRKTEYQYMDIDMTISIITLRVASYNMDDGFARMHLLLIGWTRLLKKPGESRKIKNTRHKPSARFRYS